MNGKEFLASKWMREAKRPGAKKKVEDKYGPWRKRVKDSGILARAKQLYQFFLSPEITGTRKLMVIAALLYILAPIDIVPDLVPVVGWLDDIGVAGFVLKYIFSQMDSLDARNAEKVAKETPLGESGFSLDDEIEGTVTPYDPSAVDKLPEEQ